MTSMDIPLLCSLLTLLPVAAVAQTAGADATAAPAAGPGAQTSPPIWAKPDNFWYRRTVPGGNLWLNVDALHGAKTPLFDHQRLATELTLRTGVEYMPLTLPFADPAAQFVVKYDGSNAYIQEGAMAIEFIHGGYHWRCDLQIKWDWNRVPPTDYECLSRRPVQSGRTTDAMDHAADTPPNVSPDGQWEAFVHEHNIAIRPAGSDSSPTMLSADGSAADSYQAGSIGWPADSRTVTAYRVKAELFASSSVNGNVEALVARGEWSVPSR